MKLDPEEKYFNTVSSSISYFGRYMYALGGSHR
jgi:hypothetical protein